MAYLVRRLAARRVALGLLLAVLDVHALPRHVLPLAQQVRARDAHAAQPHVARVVGVVAALEPHVAHLDPRQRPVRLVAHL